MSISLASVKRIAPEPVRRSVRRRKLDRALVNAFFANAEELDRYREELRASPLQGHIADAKARFRQMVVGTNARGREYNFGGLGSEAGPRLYALIRKVGPERVVETGVCNGVSSSLILQALHENGTGGLWSIDLPEEEGSKTPDTHWSGKGGAVVPAGRTSGWIIPDYLRARWSLRRGRSQDELVPLLDELGGIDLFIHDSEHSYECMSFEFQTAFPHLGGGGILATDDVSMNTAFEEFAAWASRPVVRLDDGVALIRK